MFALTSGTTATRKFIPVTPQYLADYRRGWNIWGLKVFRDHPECQLRPIVQMSGDWRGVPHRGRHPVRRRHRPDGDDAEAHHPLALLRAGRASAGSRTRRPSTTSALRLSLPRKVGMIIAANPSTLVNLARAGDQEKEALIRDIHDGTLDRRFDIPAGRPRRCCGRVCKRHPERARELEEIVAPHRHALSEGLLADATVCSATGPAAASAPTCGTSRATSATRRSATSA